MGLFLFIIYGNNAVAQETNENPYAQFLYNFARFSGSQAGGERFTIAVLGNAAIADELKRISRNQKINGKPVRVLNYDALDKADIPQILFLSNSKSELLSEVLNETKGKPITVITEKSGWRLGKRNTVNGARHKSVL